LYEKAFEHTIHILGGLAMEYFAVLLRYLERKEGETRKKELSTFGVEKNDLVLSIVKPLNEHRSFLLSGKILNPSQLEEIHIFEIPIKNAFEIVLPNGKNLVDEKFDYVVRCISSGQVSRVKEVTSELLESYIEGTPSKTSGPKRTIFIVHGREKEPALELQKHLTRKSIDAKIFDDIREENTGNTIVELLEFIGDNVGYAFVVATPDDLGSLREDVEAYKNQLLLGTPSVKAKDVCGVIEKFSTRARQNVVFEYGLFMGALGRDKVCCLLNSETKERPSDIDGILYVPFQKSVQEVFSEIDAKLKKIDFIK
jgi:predicted nucleotide-binding protein